MTSLELYKVSYKGPTDYNGSRFIVRNITKGTRETVSYDHSANNAARAAVCESAGVYEDAVTWAGEDSTAKYYLVEPHDGWAD